MGVELDNVFHEFVADINICVKINIYFKIFQMPFHSSCAMRSDSKQILNFKYYISRINLCTGTTKMIFYKIVMMNVIYFI